MTEKNTGTTPPVTFTKAGIQVFLSFKTIVYFWFLVFGLWYLVFGIWYLVFGFWYLVFDIWYLVLNLYLVTLLLHLRYNYQVAIIRLRVRALCEAKPTLY